MAKKPSHQIDDLASAVFDRGRRGAPMPGCDCIQCFGYCMFSGEKYVSDMLARSDQAERAARGLDGRVIGSSVWAYDDR